MKKSDLEQVSQEVVKQKQKRTRPDRQPQTDPGDNAKYIRHSLRLTDPPYEGTAEYSGGFNHKAFYDWVASRDFPVYFSSYQNISDKRFKMIWAAGKVNLMAGASGQKKNYECIYTNQAR